MKAKRISGSRWIRQTLTGGLLIGGLGSCQPKITICKKTSSLAIAHSLESAVNDFFTEYGKMPGDQSRMITDSPEGRKFLTVLLGVEKTSGKPLNDRAIKFLSVRETKNKRNGASYLPVGRN